MASELATQMQRVASVTNVIATASLNRPELRIYPRRDLAVPLGITTESLSETIRVATIGDCRTALAKFNAGDRIVPIRVLLEESARADRQTLEQFACRPRAAAACRSPLAISTFGAGPINITRHDRHRQATVEATSSAPPR